MAGHLLRWLFGRAGDLAFDAGATRVMRKTKPAVYWCERLVAR